MYAQNTLHELQPSLPLREERAAWIEVTLYVLYTQILAHVVCSYTHARGFTVHVMHRQNSAYSQLASHMHSKTQDVLYICVYVYTSLDNLRTCTCTCSCSSIHNACLLLLRTCLSLAAVMHYIALVMCSLVYTYIHLHAQWMLTSFSFLTDVVIFK